MRATPWSKPWNNAGTITIEIHTFVPSANATTSANVRHLRSVIGSDTLRMYNAPVHRACGSGMLAPMASVLDSFLDSAQDAWDAAKPGRP